MSLITDLRGPFCTSALLTSINAGLVGDGLDPLSADFGIQKHPALLAHAPSLPAMAVQLTRWRMQEPRSGGWHLIAAPVQVYLAIADSDEPGALDTMAAYLDVVRATIETNLDTIFNRLTCVAADVEGQPFTNAPGVPARLGSLEFEVRALYREGTT